jgi:hypothetical protein
MQKAGAGKVSWPDESPPPSGELRRELVLVQRLVWIPTRISEVLSGGRLAMPTSKSECEGGISDGGISERETVWICILTRRLRDVDNIRQSRLHLQRKRLRMLALALENDSGDSFMWALLFLCRRGQSALDSFTSTLQAIQVYQSMLLQQGNKRIQT